jgi:hypothetical protein
MRTALLTFALAYVCGFTLAADPVDYTYSAGGMFTSYANQNDAYVLYIPQFNPDLGTLDSITYSFTDAMTGLGGYNDMGAPEGTTFTYTWTGADTANFFTASASNSMQVMVSAGGGVNISGGGFDSALNLAANGTLTGNAMQQFIGAGDLAITITPTMDSYAADASNNAWITTGPEMAEIWDSTELSITYVDAPAVIDAVPEPQAPALLLVGLLALFVGAKRAGVRNRNATQV